MPTRNALALAFGIALVVWAYTMARPVATAGPPGRDFEAYWSAGAAYNAGVNPYSRAIWQFERTVPEVDTTRDELLPFIGPPYTLLLWSLLARMPFMLAVQVWRTVLAVAAFGIVLGAASLGRMPMTPARVAGLLLVGMAFGPLTSAFALGQVALLAFAGLIGTFLALRFRTTAGAVAGAVAGALVAATQPNLAILLVVRLRERHTWIACAIALVIAVAVAVVALGPKGVAAYLPLLRAHGESERFVTIQITPAAVAYGFTGAPDFALWAGILTGVAIAAATLLVAWRLRDGLTAAALACCAAPFVLPFFHEHDLVVMLLPAVLCAVRLRGTLLAFASAGTTLASVDWIGLAQRPTGVVQSVAMACAVAIGFAVVARDEGRARFAGLLVPLVAAAFGAIATTHSAPVWPDALPAHFHAPDGLGASRIWALEQHAAGLDNADPFWALLRLTSLAGCALLWCALMLQGAQQRANASMPARAERRYARV